MTISLPTDPKPNGATPVLRDFGGVLTPFLGGPEQRINRVGTRFGIRVSMPPLESSVDGRLFVARLNQAKTDRLLMEWPLLDFNPGSPGSPLVSAATASGSTVPLKGMTPGYQGKEGQFLSFVHSSRRYMHMLTADFIVNGSGNATAAIFPMLRVGLSLNDVVEIATPMIEGHVVPGDELSWEMSVDRLIGISFSVMEAA